MSVVVDDNGVRAFDLRTHIRDPKSGKTVTKQPYRMMTSREHGIMFERGGVRYYPNGDRVDGVKETAKPAPKPQPMRIDEDEPPAPAAPKAQTTVKVVKAQVPVADAMGVETKAEK